MKIKVSNLLLEDNSITVITDCGNCKILIEPEVAYRVKYEFRNEYKPLPSMWDIPHLLGIEFDEYNIKTRLEDDYYAAITYDGKEIPMRISDAMIVLRSTDTPIFIDDSLLELTSDSLTLRLQQAIEEENFTLAGELKKQIDETKNK
jgi:bifunctional DNase/RNase